MKKWLIWSLLVPLDFLLLPFVCLILFVAWMRCRCRPRRRKTMGAILHLSSAGSVEATLRKFGSLDFLFNYDGSATRDVFQRNIVFWFPTKNTLLMEINDWILIERRIRCPVLSAVCIYLISVLIVVYRYDVRVIRSWDPYFSGLFGLILSRMTRLPFCVSIHSDYDHCYQIAGVKGCPLVLGSRQIAKRVEKFILRRAHLVLPIREYLGDQAVACGVPMERIRVIPHGLNPDLFAASSPSTIREEFGISSKTALISFVGRLSNENYVNDVLEFTRTLARKRNDFAVFMAGDGPENERLLREKDQDALLQEHLIVSGFISHEKAINLRRESDANLCLMGGFSLMEACASGKPVVSYDVQWHHELVRDGETGFLVPEGDIGRLVEAIEYLLDHPEEAERMGKAARELAFTRHGMEQTNMIKRKVYEELLSKGSFGQIGKR